MVQMLGFVYPGLVTVYLFKSWMHAFAQHYVNQSIELLDVRGCEHLMLMLE
jgi:hypothetical protein